ncbi:MAG: prepilin-type N-terminal cleavage/methylation domain-containing protein, partial [Bacilli bacterium]|nr:prepilin-type N-terminal cleavage/methylation domain-containing protein [Bacilli bacterium]
MGGGQLNKAFTLIELLAIIVILAIIAIITIPIILNVVDNAKKGAAIDSAYGYKDSVYKSFLSDMFDDSTKELPNGTYTLTETGKLVRSEPLSELTVDVQGDVPSEGWMEL